MALPRSDGDLTVEGTHRSPILTPRQASRSPRGGEVELGHHGECRAPADFERGVGPGHGMPRGPFPEMRADQAAAMQAEEPMPLCRRWLLQLTDPAGLIARFRRLLALVAMITFMLAWYEIARQLGTSEERRMYVVRFGYGIGVLMLLGFYAWEDGPCHKTRGIESIYIALGLTLVVVATENLRPHRPDRADGGAGCEYDGDPCEVDESNRVKVLIWTVLMMRILQHAGATKMHPAFAEGPAGAVRAAAAQRWMPQPTPRARRVALELEEGLSEIFRKEGDGKQPSNWELAVLGLLILERVVWTYPVRLLFVARLATFAEVLLVVPLLYLGLRRCFMAPAVQRLVLAVQDLVQREEKDTLQYVLATLSVGTLLEAASTGLLKELTEQALRKGLLSPLSKAVLVDALQKKGLVLNGNCQQAVARVLLSCKGEELSAVKNLVDASGSHLNLYKLVYTDISDASLRRQVLRHFAVEAEAVRDALGRSKGIKVLSDIDDTLYASGGTFPAGCDRRLPRHMIYPGCLSLYRTLDKEWGTKKDPCCNLVFLSARPHVYKGVSEDHSYQLFSRLIREGFMHGMPTLLPGRLLAGVRVLVTFPLRRQRAWGPIGDLKVTMYWNYRALYREYDFVFCGDNGQGDLWAGQLMAAEQEMRDALPVVQHGSPNDQRRRRHRLSVASQLSDQPAPHQVTDRSRLLAVLIHEVLPQDACLAREPAHERGAQWVDQQRCKRLFVFRSYIGAALALHRADPALVSIRELVAVATEAVDEFNTARLMYLEWGRESWAAAEAAIRGDLAQVAELLDKAGEQGLPKPATLKSMDELLSIAGPISDTRLAAPRFTLRALRDRGSTNGDMELWWELGHGQGQAKATE